MNIVHYLIINQRGLIMELTLDGIEKMRFEKEAQELFENQSHMRIPEFADACFWLADKYNLSTTEVDNYMVFLLKEAT